jgi:hypothetical protein
LPIAQAQHDIIASRPVNDARNDPTIGKALKLFSHLRRLKSKKRRTLVINPDVDLRNARLLLDLQIDESGNARQPLAHVFGDRAQRVEIIAKYFERNLRAHAREHVVKTMGNRLPYVD